MNFEITNKKLFLKYAIPCASTLVMRGDVKQKRIDELKNWAISGKGEAPGSKELQKIFKVAYTMCLVAAKDLEKTEIDTEAIREYFMNRHDKTVEERWQEKQDFDKEACKVKILTLEEKAKYKKDFCPDAKPGDIIVVHYDYIVEKLLDKKQQMELLKSAKIVKI